MTNKRYVVYCHTNLVNGKKYIGITCQKLQNRFRNGKGYKSSPHFNSAIQKYGWENFLCSILEDNLLETEAKEKEKYYIDKYQTRNALYGYNTTPGGEGYSGEDNPWFGKHHSEETRRLMSEKRKNIPKSEEWKRKISESNKGRIVSEESKEKMRKNHCDVSGSNNPRYGKKLSKEMIQRLVAASKTPEAIEKMKKNKKWYSGGDNPNAKAVICIETMITYPTVKAAAEANNCNPSKVSDVCSGKRRHTHNLHFKYLENK